MDRGGIVGGTSAGAMIQAARMPTAKPDEAFGFLRKTLLMPHMNRGRARELLVEVINATSDLVGLGVSENTAAIVRGDSLEVIGDGDVIVVDGAAHAGSPYIVLKSGDHLVLKPRSPRPPATKR